MLWRAASFLPLFFLLSLAACTQVPPPQTAAEGLTQASEDESDAEEEGKDGEDDLGEDTSTDLHCEGLEAPAPSESLEQESAVANAALQPLMVLR